MKLENLADHTLVNIFQVLLKMYVKGAYPVLDELLATGKAPDHGPGGQRLAAG